MVTISEKPEAGDDLPPTYTESSSMPSGSVLSQDDLSRSPPSVASSSSFLSNLPLSPPTNFLTISRSNQAIKGKWTIDPSLPAPPGSIPSADKEGRPYNAFLHSDNGAVDVVIQIFRSGDAKGPARLSADSHNGSITVTVHDQQCHRFRLLAASHNGAITVRLPSTYTGTVSTLLHNGKLTFSPDVRARLTTFSEHGNEGRFFIGDWAGSGYENDETWLGNHLRIESGNGKIRISFIDEQTDAPSSKGFFSKLLG